jgi:hypothetical protein
MIMQIYFKNTFLSLGSSIIKFNLFSATYTDLLWSISGIVDTYYISAVCYGANYNDIYIAAKDYTTN